jgi:hypothetical protein
MKVAELEGAQLDAWVARASGMEWLLTDWRPGSDLYLRGDEGEYIPYSPSTDWNQGGPIIEREHIDLAFGNVPETWEALVRPEYEYGTYMRDDGRGTGRTALIAAMRAYVASKFGDEVPEVY